MKSVAHWISYQFPGETGIAHAMIGFLALIIIFAAPCLAQQREDKMLISYGGLGGYQLPLWFGAELKIFDRYGVQARPIFIPSAANSMKALLSGDTQGTQTSGSAAINAILNGADLVIITAPYNVLPYNFYAAKGITRPEDLKGKKIGILNFGGVTEYATMMLLKDWGLDPRRDVTVIQIGNDPTRLAALMAGSIQGTTLTHPAMNKAESLGFKLLANLTEMGIKFPTNTVTVRRGWLKENRATAEKFLKGYIASIHAMKNREQDAIKVLAKYTKIEDRDSLVKTFRYYSAGIPIDPRIDSKAIEAVLATFEKTMPGASQHAPSQFFDSAPLEAVERSGFIQELTR